MIDTITFLLHSMNEQSISLSPNEGKKVYKMPFNRLLYERLSEYESSYIVRNKKFLNESVLINSDDEYFKRKTIDTIGIVKRKGAIVDSMNKKEFFFYPVNGSIQTASSEYRCQFSINENTDAIKFEFSIPKYLYNHNIAQFVPNLNSKRFQENPFLLRDFMGQVKFIRTRLIEFIYTFFNDLSILLDMPNIFDFDIRNIEIKRLDLCYNQFFPSKSAVHDYLTAQRKFYKSKVRSNTDVKEDRDTSFYYRHSNDGFFFKIYEKSDEFLANDFNKILKENKQLFSNEKFINAAKPIFKKYFEKAYNNANSNVQDLLFNYYSTYVKSKENKHFVSEIETLLPYKLSFLLEQSEEILRYEMSFTTTYLSTLYKRELFRKKDSNWKKMFQNYKIVKDYYKLVSDGKQEKANEKKRFYKIDKQKIIHYELIDKSLHKKHEFHLITDKKLQQHEATFSNFHLYLSNNKKQPLHEEKKATFSEDLFKVIYQKFYDEIKFFQITEVKETKTVLEQIDLYNIKVQNKIDSYIKTFGNESFKKLPHTYKRKNGFSKIQRSRIKVFLDYQKQGYSQIQIFQIIGLKKSAQYTLIDDLKKFDIFKNTIKTKYDFKNIKTDFSEYYSKFQIDRNYHSKLFHQPNMLQFDTIRNPIIENFAF